MPSKLRRRSLSGCEVRDGDEEDEVVGGVLEIEEEVELELEDGEELEGRRAGMAIEDDITVSDVRLEWW